MESRAMSALEWRSRCAEVTESYRGRAQNFASVPPDRIWRQEF